MSDHSRAIERALRSLSVRERTEHELRVFLDRREFEPDVIDDVIVALRGEGLLDDAGYARRFAEDRRLLDRWGNERIARDLVRRGVERELIDQALAGNGGGEGRGGADRPGAGRTRPRRGDGGGSRAARPPLPAPVRGRPRSRQGVADAGSPRLRGGTGLPGGSRARAELPPGRLSATPELQVRLGAEYL